MESRLVFYYLFAKIVSPEVFLFIHSPVDIFSVVHFSFTIPFLDFVDTPYGERLLALYFDFL